MSIDERWNAVTASELSFGRRLDQSLLPVRALREMATVAQPRGIVLTLHAEDEGLEHGYPVLHGWNFSVAPETLETWNAEQRHDAATELADMRSSRLSRPSLPTRRRSSSPHSASTPARETPAPTDNQRA